MKINADIKTFNAEMHRLVSPESLITYSDILLIVLGVFCVALPYSFAAPPRYQYLDLGPTEAYDVNSQGEVALRVGNRAHKWNIKDGLLDLDLGSPSIAYAINDIGQVGGHVGHLPFVLENGQINILFTPGGQRGEVKQLNNQGQAVGKVGINPRAALWEADGEFRDLGILPNAINSWGYGINENGIVVGVSIFNCNGTFSPTYGKAFIWDGKLSELGVPQGYGDSNAKGINNLNQIVGTSGQSGECGTIELANQRGWIYTVDAGFTLIEPPMGFSGTYASSINNHGTVVGGLQDFNGSAAGIFYNDGVTYDLIPYIDGIPVNWLPFRANRISDQDAIVGAAWNILDPRQWRAFVLLPKR